MTGATTWSIAAGGTSMDNSSSWFMLVLLATTISTKASHTLVRTWGRIRLSPHREWASPLKSGVAAVGIEHFAHLEWAHARIEFAILFLSGHREALEPYYEKGNFVNSSTFLLEVNIIIHLVS